MDKATKQCPVCAGLFGPSNARGHVGRWAAYTRHVRKCAAEHGKAAVFMGDPRKCNLSKDKRWFVVDVPQGWRRVIRGSVKPGDLCINCMALWFDGLTSWLNVNDVPKRQWCPLEEQWHRNELLDARVYGILIRRDVPVMAEAVT